MKTKTKEQIIRFVKKVLKYEETKNVTIKEETRKLHELKVSFKIPFGTEKNMINNILASTICEELVKLNLIDIDYLNIEDISNIVNGKDLLYMKASVFVLEPYGVLGRLNDEIRNPKEDIYM